MPTDRDRIRSYYSAFDEWSRLDTAEGAVELARALRVIEQHLPASARILDLGGGAGRYSVALARRGHRVTLADLSPELLASARRKLAELGVGDAIEAIDEADAANLDRYAAGRFDAVVAFGPFYHLVSEVERRRAAREVHRVLRPGGLAFVASIPRLSGLAALIQRAAETPEQVPPGTLRTVAETGAFHNPAASGFQEGYYAAPGEMRALLAGSGFEVVDELSLRSIAYGLAADLARLAEPLHAEAELLMDELARRPEVLATAGHVLSIARRV